MRSVRLGDKLETRLKRAAKESGLPASQIIRDGVEERVSMLLGDTVAKRMADVIGAVCSDPKTHGKSHKEEFAAIMAAKHPRRSSVRRKAAG